MSSKEKFFVSNLTLSNLCILRPRNVRTKEKILEYTRFLSAWMCECPGHNR